MRSVIVRPFYLSTRRNEAMKKFIPKEKLGKKACKQLDSEQRTTWTFSPVTKKVESKKLYNRKRKSHDRYDDYGMGFLLPGPVILQYR